MFYQTAVCDEALILVDFQITEEEDKKRLTLNRWIVSNLSFYILTEKDEISSV